VAKATQNVAQYLAPIEEREKLRMRIIELRKRYFKVLQDLCRRREIYRWLLPLLEQYRDHGGEIKAWLDVTESRAEGLTTNFKNNEFIIQNEDLIEVSGIGEASMLLSLVSLKISIHKSF